MTLTRVTQADQVLELLRERGETGAHTSEIYALYIANPSQRIAILERRGHVIESVREKSPHGDAMGARYTLVHDAETGQQAAPTMVDEPWNEPAPETGGLFDGNQFHTPRGHWEDAA